MDKLFKKEDNVDIEEFLNNLDVSEESMYEDADALVKSLTLSKDNDVDIVANELKQGNIVLLNIGDMSKRNALKLKELVNGIRSNVESIDGDMARISTDRVLVTPSKVKIVKKKS